MGKPKKISYTLITDKSELGKPMYEMLDELVAEHHADDLTHARIALAWCTSWRADVDGRVVLGKCKKASDLDRELAVYDFIVLLSHEFWTNPSVTDLQRRALLDHELMHATCQWDGEQQKKDERGRVVYRIRKHDIEEFGDIVERYGCYKRDLERFAQSLRRSKQPPLDLSAGDMTEAIDNFVATTPEGGSVTLSAGGRTVHIDSEDGAAARKRVADRWH